MRGFAATFPPPTPSSHAECRFTTPACEFSFMVKLLIALLAFAGGCFNRASVNARDAVNVLYNELAYAEERAPDKDKQRWQDRRELSRQALIPLLRIVADENDQEMRGLQKALAIPDIE